MKFEASSSRQAYSSWARVPELSGPEPQERVLVSESREEFSRSTTGATGSRAHETRVGSTTTTRLLALPAWSGVTPLHLALGSAAPAVLTTATSLGELDGGTASAVEVRLDGLIFAGVRTLPPVGWDEEIWFQVPWALLGSVGEAGANGRADASVSIRVTARGVPLGDVPELHTVDVGPYIAGRNRMLDQLRRSADGR